MKERWKDEFPEGYAAGPWARLLALHGFEDISWHNDMCPSFWHEGAKVKVWVDHPNPSKREFEESRHFAVVMTDEEGCDEDRWILETDSPEEMMETVTRLVG